MAESIFPLRSLEVVCGGTVVAATEGDGFVVWLLPRKFPSTSPHRSRHERSAVFARTSPIYVACGARSMADRDRLRCVRALVAGGLDHLVTHHHGEPATTPTSECAPQTCDQSDSGASVYGRSAVSRCQGALQLFAQVQSSKLFSVGPGAEGVASIMLLLSSCISSIFLNLGLAPL